MTQSKETKEPGELPSNAVDTATSQKVARREDMEGGRGPRSLTNNSVRQKSSILGTFTLFFGTDGALEASKNPIFA